MNREKIIQLVLKDAAAHGMSARELEHYEADLRNPDYPDPKSIMRDVHNDRIARHYELEAEGNNQHSEPIPWGWRGLLLMVIVGSILGLVLTEIWNSLGF